MAKALTRERICSTLLPRQRHYLLLIICENPFLKDDDPPEIPRTRGDRDSSAMRIDTTSGAWQKYSYSQRDGIIWAKWLPNSDERKAI